MCTDFLSRKKSREEKHPLFFLGELVSLAGEQALYLKDIVKSRRARRGRARFALLAQIGALAMLRVSTKAIDQFCIVQKN